MNYSYSIAQKICLKPFDPRSYASRNALNFSAGRERGVRASANDGQGISCSCELSDSIGKFAPGVFSGDRGQRICSTQLALTLLYSNGCLCCNFYIISCC